MASERKEALFRIIVGIITGIILELWKVLTQFLILINFVLTLISGKPSKDIANFCEYYSVQLYSFYHYMTFKSNDRPFPFTKMKKKV